MARKPKVVEDRREQIIDAAMRVFSQKGFTKATNKDVAREAGITPGLIYYYFESKEALFQAILESRSPIRLIADPPPQMFDLPPEAFLRFMILQVLNIVESENFIGMARVLIPEILHNPEMVQFPMSMLQRIIAFLQMYLEAKMERRELRQLDASLIAQLFVATLMGFVLRRYILRDPLALQYSHEQIADAVLEITLKGLLPH